MEGLQKVLMWFLEANDSPNSHQNIIITCGICVTSTSNKYAKTVNLRCAGNKVLWNIKLKGGGVTPKSPLRTPLAKNSVKNVSVTLWFCLQCSCKKCLLSCDSAGFIALYYVLFCLFLSTYVLQYVCVFILWTSNLLTNKLKKTIFMTDRNITIILCPMKSFLKAVQWIFASILFSFETLTLSKLNFQNC